MLLLIALEIERKKLAPEARKQRTATEKLKKIPKYHFYFCASPDPCPSNVNSLTGRGGPLAANFIDAGGLLTEGHGYDVNGFHGGAGGVNSIAPRIPPG